MAFVSLTALKRYKCMDHYKTDACFIRLTMFFLLNMASELFTIIFRRYAKSFYWITEYGQYLFDHSLIMINWTTQMHIIEVYCFIFFFIKTDVNRINSSFFTQTRKAFEYVNINVSCNWLMLILMIFWTMSNQMKLTWK